MKIRTHGSIEKSIHGKWVGSSFNIWFLFVVEMQQGDGQLKVDGNQMWDPKNVSQY